MSKDYKILQIGIDNWAHHYEIPENMDWYYFCPNSPLALRKMMEMEGITSFQAILIEDGQYIRDLLPFIHHIEPYTLLYSQDYKTTDLEINYFHLVAKFIRHLKVLLPIKDLSM